MRWIKHKKLIAERRNTGWQVDEDSVNSLLQVTEQIDELIDEQVMNESSPKDLVELKMRVVELEAKLSGKEELIRQLRDELGHLRKPFWKRMIDL